MIDTGEIYGGKKEGQLIATEAEESRVAGDLCEGKTVHSLIVKSSCLISPHVGGMDLIFFQRSNGISQDWRS